MEYFVDLLRLDIDKELENADKKEEQCKPESDERESKVKIEPVSTKGKLTHDTMKYFYNGKTAI